MVKKLLDCNSIQSFLTQGFLINKLLSFILILFHLRMCVLVEKIICFRIEKCRCVSVSGGGVCTDCPGCHLSWGSQALFTLSLGSGSLVDLEFTRYRMGYLTTASTIFASSVLRCQWHVSTLSLFTRLWGLKSSPHAWEATSLLTYLAP